MRRAFTLPWRTTRQIRADVDAELRFHLDERIDALLGAGLTLDQARATAMREFGDLEDARRYIGRVDHDIEAARRRSDVMHDLQQDIAYALRTLRAAPLFALTVIATLALGIGANTAIFSVVNAVLLEALPFPHAHRLVQFAFTMGGTEDAGSPPELADFRSKARTLSGVAMYGGAVANLVRANGEPERLPAVTVSSNWFDILGVTPLHGRGFVAGEDDEGGAKVVVISESVWRRDFGADPTLVGRGIRVNGQVYTVVGIIPVGRGFPLAAEMWLPFVLDASELSDAQRGARYVNMVARLRDGVTVDAARAELGAISRQTESAFPKKYNHFVVGAVALQESVVGELRRPLLVIMSAVALVLLVACANVANLMLVRATARESEMAIRSALGAGRGRLVRQLVTESLLLTAIGAAAGVLLAHFGMGLLLRLAPPSLPAIRGAHIDRITIAVTALIAAITGIVFGVLPALQRRSGALSNALRAGARGSRGLPGAHRTKRAIVIGEVALAMMLLAGAGLLLRSFQRLMAVDPGFHPQGIVSFRVSLPDGAYPKEDDVRRFVAALDERLRAIPGVQQVGVSNALPLDRSDFTISFTIRGHAPVPENEQPSAQIVTISPGFLPTVGIPVVSGRNFSAADRDGTPQVAIVSRAFVQKYFPAEDPIGKYVELGWKTNGVRRGGTIVGVVGDVKQYALDAASPATVYLPFDQTVQQGLRFTVRTAVPPSTVVASARAAVHAIDRELPVFSVRTLEEQLALSVAPQRFYAMLVALFAGVALLLAAVGLYGVIAYAVSQRAHELGIRVALGATAQGITRMVVREGLVLAAAGTAIGIVAALFAARLLSSLLFGVTAGDPPTFIGVAALLLVVAGVASWLPARRASRVDPLVAMRGE